MYFVSFAFYGAVRENNADRFPLFNMKAALPGNVRLDLNAVVPFGIGRKNTEVKIERVKDRFGGR